MWIFTNRGFLSIVEDKDDPHRLLVRARYKGDIEAHFSWRTFDTSQLNVVETSEADYRFRVSLPRETVSAQIHSFVNGIDYPNFKDSCHFNSGDSTVDGVKNRSLFRVWDTMKCSQDGIAKLEQ